MDDHAVQGTPANVNGLGEVSDQDARTHALTSGGGRSRVNMESAANNDTREEKDGILLQVLEEVNAAARVLDGDDVILLSNEASESLGREDAKALVGGKLSASELETESVEHAQAREINDLKQQVTSLKSKLDASKANEGRMKTFFEGVQKVNSELQASIVGLLEGKKEQEAEIIELKELQGTTLSKLKAVKHERDELRTLLAKVMDAKEEEEKQVDVLQQKIQELQTGFSVREDATVKDTSPQRIVEPTKPPHVEHILQPNVLPVAVLEPEPTLQPTPLQKRVEEQKQSAKRTESFVRKLRFDLEQRESNRVKSSGKKLRTPLTVGRQSFGLAVATPEVHTPIRKLTFTPHLGSLNEATGTDLIDEGGLLSPSSSPLVERGKETVAEASGNKLKSLTDSLLRELDRGVELSSDPVGY
mmetsp:Transcript_35024/g.56034  ORF Transcript_35024/g.56034 Transcript_35024/m.56034 type:complete len:418 (-) Transcript_35024:1033-2286(-)